MDVTAILILASLFALGFLLVFRCGGFRSHTYFSFALLLYFQYLFIGAINTVLEGKVESLGVSVADEISEGLAIYNVGLFVFILSYWSHYVSEPKRAVRSKLRAAKFDDRILIALTVAILILCYVARFIGLDVEGSLGTYIGLSQDFLIVLLIALSLRKIKPSISVPLIALALALFAFNFFRYRVYLTVIGLGTVYYFGHPNLSKHLLRYAAIASVALYAVLFVTVNRYPLVALEFDKLNYAVWNDENSSKDSLVDQSTNIYADFVVFKYFKYNPLAEHDAGVTMFIYPFVRAAPAAFFEGGIKPYPPPSLALIISAYGGGKVAETAGRAVSNIGEFFIAFGHWGVFFGMSVFGIALKRLQSRWIWDDSYGTLTHLAVLISLLQYVTRGYLPQYITHLAYLISPIFIIKWISNYGAKSTSVT